MQEHENEITAGDVMHEEEPQQASAEVNAQTLMGAVSGVADEPEPAQENAQQHAQENAQEESPEDAQVRAYTEGISGLYDAGWTQEEVAELIADAAALRDISGGKTIAQAAHAYMRRQMQAASGEKPAEKQDAMHRRSVPTMKQASGAARSAGSRIDELSREEFARLRKRAEQAMLEGKLVSFD